MTVAAVSSDEDTPDCRSTQLTRTVGGVLARQPGPRRRAGPPGRPAQRGRVAAVAGRRPSGRNSSKDLIEANGAHFLGTVITLNQTTDAVYSGVLELIDGQQRMTTLTLLLAAVYSVLKEHYEELDDGTRTDVTTLGWQLVRWVDGEPRVVPQIQ